MFHSNINEDRFASKTDRMLNSNTSLFVTDSNFTVDRRTRASQFPSLVQQLSHILYVCLILIKCSKTVVTNLVARMESLSRPPSTSQYMRTWTHVLHLQSCSESHFTSFMQFHLRKNTVKCTLKLKIKLKDLHDKPSK